MIVEMVVEGIVVREMMVMENDGGGEDAGGHSDNNEGSCGDGDDGSCYSLDLDYSPKAKVLRTNSSLSHN